MVCVRLPVSLSDLLVLMDAVVAMLVRSSVVLGKSGELACAVCIIFESPLTERKYFIISLISWQTNAKAMTMIIIAGIIHGAEGLKRFGCLINRSKLATNALVSLSLAWSVVISACILRRF